MILFLPDGGREITLLNVEPASRMFVNWLHIYKYELLLVRIKLRNAAWGTLIHVVEALIAC